MKYTIDLKIADSVSAVVSEPSTVASLLQEEFDPLQEELHLLMLDNGNKVIGKHLVCKGGYAHLEIRAADVIRPLLFTNGNSAILAHNHPSGSLNPSEEDILFTRHVNEAFKLMSLNLLDHIIYTADGYYSFKKEGLI